MGEERERSPKYSGGEREAVDISDTPAPSIGPHTTFEKSDPQTRMARSEQSDIDAMGLDKRREVIGGSYSPSFARQATMYGIVVAIVLGFGIGFKLLADKLDEPPATFKDEAPWTGTTKKPTDLDFPRNGTAAGAADAGAADAGQS
jgi:hypothetical protein